MHEVLFVKKEQATDSIDTDMIIKIFERNDNLEMINTAVKKAKERLYVSWASVEMKDKAGELIPIKDMIDQQETLLARNGPITDNHTNKVVGQTLAYKVLKHPKTNTYGVLHLNKIFDTQNEIDDKVWSEIQSGERKGSSVGGYNTSMAFGHDKATGEKSIVLDGFKHMETASVYNPCNPMALNEAFSLVAKSDVSKSNIEIPKDQLEAGIKVEMEHTNDEKVARHIALDHLLEDVEYYKKLATIEKNKENVINKICDKESINKTSGGNTMENDVIKSISEISETIKSLTAAVSKVSADLKEMKDEKDKETKEKKKAKEEEDSKEDKEEDMKEKKKENASIEGLNGKDSPKSPDPKDNNEKEVFKKIAELEKKLSEVVSKSETPRMPNSVEKKDAMSSLALDIASGKKQMTWMDVHKATESQNNQNGGLF